MAKKLIGSSAVRIGVVGGLGLGLLLGNEFSGSWVTILGAILVVTSIGSMILFKKK